MDKFDYPWILKKQIQVVQERAAKVAASVQLESVIASLAGCWEWYEIDPRNN